MNSKETYNRTSLQCFEVNCETAAIFYLNLCCSFDGKIASVLLHQIQASEQGRAIGVNSEYSLFEFIVIDFG